MNAAAPISLVTEANRGIGRATVRQLAGPRHMVLLYARRPEDAGSAAASLAGRHVGLEPLQFASSSSTRPQIGRTH
ncbi:hypothetical protein [Streptomyces hirsutus]|uniref:hypothetical protein n=1 Tax=Streptomyces hirsutus TaxID=35620 RepID=UPI003697E701